MTQQTTNALRSLRLLTSLILESAVLAGDRGLISGHLYAVLCGKLSLDQYNQLMSGLVNAGMLTERGHVYTATVKAHDYCNKGGVIVNLDKSPGLV